jgi:hypothetical protein
MRPNVRRAALAAALPLIAAFAGAAPTQAQEVTLDRAQLALGNTAVDVSGTVVCSEPLPNFPTFDLVVSQPVKPGTGVLTATAQMSTPGAPPPFACTQPGQTIGWSTRARQSDPPQGVFRRGTVLVEVKNLTVCDSGGMCSTGFPEPSERLPLLPPDAP